MMQTITKEQAQLMLEEMQTDPAQMKALFDRGHPGHEHHKRKFEAITKVQRAHEGLREPSSPDEAQLGQLLAEVGDDPSPLAKQVITDLKAKVGGRGATLLAHSEKLDRDDLLRRRAEMEKDKTIAKALVNKNDPRHEAILAEWMEVNNRLAPSEGEAAWAA